MFSEISTKEILLKTTLEIVAEKGAYSISIREIASRAGVNSAAISYYFGSKDKLLVEASNLYYKQIGEIFELLGEKERKPLERLKVFSIELISYINKYPGFLKNEIAQHLLSSVADQEAGVRVKLQVNAIMEVLSEIVEVESKELLFIKAIQFLSCLVYPQLWSKYSSEITIQGIDYFVVGEAYIDELIKSICEL